MENRSGLRPISVFLLVAIWLKLQYFLEKLPFAGNSSTISKMHIGVCSFITIVNLLVVEMGAYTWWFDHKYIIMMETRTFYICCTLRF